MIDLPELKRSSKLLIYDSRHYLYCVYRGLGGWTNPNTISLIGADGDTLDGVLLRLREKFNLVTEAGDWSFTGKVENPADQYDLDIRAADRQPCFPARRLWRASLPQAVDVMAVRTNALAGSSLGHAGNAALVRRTVRSTGADLHRPLFQRQDFSPEIRAVCSRGCVVCHLFVTSRAAFVIQLLCHLIVIFGL